MSKLKISKIAAAVVLGSAFFAGCNVYDVKSAPVTPPVVAEASSFTAADGYVINLNGNKATAICDNDNIYSSIEDQNLTLGKINFENTLTADCTISVGSDAYIDVNDNGIFDSSDTQIGYELKAPGDAKVVSQLTSLVVAKKEKAKTLTGDEKTALEAEIASLATAVNDYNPVEAATTIAAGGTNADKYKKLAVLAEVLKTSLKAGSVSDSVGINTSTYSDTTTTIETLNVANTLPATITNNTALNSAVTTKATAITSVVKILDQIDTTKIDVKKLLVNVSDGDKTLTEALTSSTQAGASITTTDVTTFIKSGSTTVTNASITSIDTAATDANSAVASAPAKLTLGNTLKIGTKNVTMTNAKFTTSIASANITSFYDVTLPTAVITKSFTEDDVNISVTIADNNENQVSISIAGAKIAPNGSSVKVTIPSGATITATQTGLSALNAIIGESATATTTSELLNEDLRFNVNSILGVLGSNQIPNAITALNNYLSTAGTYTMTIELSGLDNLATDYTKVTGTVTVTE
jgi:hypothetical protein